MTTQQAGRYMVIWHDESNVPRAWGSADDQPTAEAMADIQRDEYLAGGRWDVHLVRRVTHEFLAENVSVEVAEVRA